MDNSAPLKTTPLHRLHREMGGRLVPFAGWSMPVQFAGLVQEHLCVRKAVGVFDVSHMGEIEVEGAGSAEFLQRLVSNDLSRMGDGGIVYTVMCYENGGIVDDLLVHRISPTRYFLCVNASNTDKDFEWVSGRARGLAGVNARNISAETAQLAVQGPRAEALMKKIAAFDPSPLRYYRFTIGRVAGVECIAARTGYTGEDGFELYFPSAQAETLYRAILDAGAEFGIQPIGLGARDTLRLEMGYSLYGNEIGPETSPLERGLGWVVKLDKGEFVGAEVLARQKREGVKKKLAALRLLERGVPRSHYPVLCRGGTVGEVTSGTFSPSLNVGIALACVAAEHAAPGARLEVDIRGQHVPAEVVKTPFVPGGVKK